MRARDAVGVLTAMTRPERDLVAALRAELAAIDPSRPCDRRAEAAGLAAATPGARGPGRAAGRPAGAGERARRRRRPTARGPRGRAAAVRLGRLAPSTAGWPGCAACSSPAARSASPSGRTHLEFVVAAGRGAASSPPASTEVGLPAAWRLRRGRGVVTWKSADTVGLFLRRIGAGGALLELEARQVARALRGDLNRVLNAESANLQRAVGAAGRQIAAIDELERDGRARRASRRSSGWSPTARRETPEATLGELAERLEPPPLGRPARARADRAPRAPSRRGHRPADAATRPRRRGSASDRSATEVGDSGIMWPMRPVIVAANWKMNTTPADAGELARTIASRTAEPAVERVICPPFVCLAAVGDALAGDRTSRSAPRTSITRLAGAYTGDICAAMLAGLATWVIVGHSERRRDHGETDERIAAKLGRAVEAGLRPILCVGEPLAVREAGADAAADARRRPAAGRRRPARPRPRSREAGLVDRLRAGLGDRDGPERERRRCRGDGRGDPRRAARTLGWGDRADDVADPLRRQRHRGEHRRVPRRALDRRRARRRRVAQARRDGRDRRPGRRDRRRPAWPRPTAG